MKMRNVSRIPAHSPDCRCISTAPRGLGSIGTLIFFLLTAFPGIPAASHVSRVSIHIDTSRFRSPDLREMAESLVYLRAGTPFAPPVLEQSLQALRTCERFETVLVDSTRHGKDSLAFHFTLEPYPVISSIRISGAYPLFRSAVLRTLTLTPGDVLKQSELSNQKELLMRLFALEGFDTPTITLAVHPENEGGTGKGVVLNVRIERGESARVIDYIVSGNRTISNAALKLRMHTWRSSILPGELGRFVRERFRADIESLTELYRKRGFAEVDITTKVVPQETPNRLRIIIRIHEGPRYRISFSGNQRLSDRALERESPLVEHGNIGDRGLRQYARNIELRYRRIGYLEPGVSFKTKLVDQPGRSPVRSVTFLVREGPRPAMDSVQLKGVTVFTREELGTHLLTVEQGLFQRGTFREETLAEDIFALRALYRNRGYLQSRVTADVEWNPESTGVNVTLVVHEGTQSVVKGVSVHTVDPGGPDLGDIKLETRPGEPYREYLVHADASALSTSGSDQGYPHIRVDPTVSFNDDSSSVIVRYDVRTGPFVRVGKVFFTGTFRTDETILRRRLGLTSGDTLILSDILSSRGKLQELSILDSVSIRSIGLAEKRDSVHLFITAREQNTYLLETGGGFQTDRGFFLMSRLTNRNLFGKNKRAWLEGEVGQTKQLTKIGLLEPRLFREHLSASVDAGWERETEFGKSFGTVGWSINTGLNRRWSQTLSSGLSLRYERRSAFTREDRISGSFPADTSKERSRNAVILGPSARYDTRNSLIRPRSGFWLSVLTDFSKGIDNPVEDYVRVKCEAKTYLTPDELDWITLAVAARTGHIVTYTGKQSEGSVPADRLFFLGGTGSVRGYEPNLLEVREGTNEAKGFPSMLSATIEPRFSIGNKFELPVFLDLGSLSEGPEDLFGSDIHLTAGGGLRYMSPIGPVGVLYGIEVTRPRSGRDRSQNVHATVGYSF